MRIRPIVVAAAAALFAAAPFSSPARAQNAPRGSVVAVIDLDYVLKNSDRFKEIRLALNSESEALNQEAKEADKALKKLAEEARSYEGGTPEHKEIEAEFARKKADIEVSLKQRDTELSQKHARELFGVYEEILDLVKDYCEKNAIDVVLQVYTETPEESQVQLRQRRMAQTVFYSVKEIDITNDILNLHNPDGGSSRPSRKERPTVGRNNPGKTKLPPK